MKESIKLKITLFYIIYNYYSDKQKPAPGCQGAQNLLEMKPTILNTSILTNYGSYNYDPLTLEQARELVQEGFDSAVGHQSTCDVLSTLLGVKVPMNRVQYAQNVGDVALVFKLNGRPEEGKILSAQEIEQIGYAFGKLTRTA